MRCRRLTLVAVVLAVAVGGLAVFYVASTFDSAAERAVGRLRPGLTTAEARRALADVPYLDYVREGSGALVVEVPSGNVSVAISGDRVAAIDRVPDTGPVWDRLRRTWDRHRRAWEYFRRNRHRAPAG